VEAAGGSAAMKTSATRKSASTTVEASTSASAVAAAMLGKRWCCEADQTTRSYCRKKSIQQGGLTHGVTSTERAVTSAEERETASSNFTLLESGGTRGVASIGGLYKWLKAVCSIAIN
jgi:hypothetical protein